MTEDEIGKRVVDAAVHIHRELGPGLWSTKRGYLLNFGESMMKNGITGTVNRLVE